MNSFSNMSNLETAEERYMAITSRTPVCFDCGYEYLSEYKPSDLIELNGTGKKICIECMNNLRASFEHEIGKRLKALENPQCEIKQA